VSSRIISERHRLLFSSLLFAAKKDVLKVL